MEAHTAGGLLPSRPSPENAALARTALRLLEPLARQKPTTVSLAPPDGEAITVELPGAALQVLVEVLGQMASGGSVVVMPQHAELTTQQAAEFLQVSRPFLIGLLDRGDIPCRKVGSHRRVRMGDLLAYQEREDAQRRAVLQALADDAQELGLGYPDRQP